MLLLLLLLLMIVLVLVLVLDEGKLMLAHGLRLLL
jgi:hypothetical protein